MKFAKGSIFFNLKAAKAIHGAVFLLDGSHIIFSLFISGSWSKQKFK